MIMFRTPRSFLNSRHLLNCLMLGLALCAFSYVFDVDDAMALYGNMNAELMHLWE